MKVQRELKVDKGNVEPGIERIAEVVNDLLNRGILVSVLVSFDDPELTPVRKPREAAAATTSTAAAPEGGPPEGEDVAATTAAGKGKGAKGK